MKYVYYWQGLLAGSKLIEINKWKKKINKTRSTQRARPPWPRQIITPILPTAKNVEPWWWKTNPQPPLPHPQKRYGSLPAPRSGYATTIMVFFRSFTHLRTPRSPPKFNVLHCTTQDSSIKFYPNPFITFWVMLSTDRQTDRQTNKPTLPKT